MSKHLRLLLIGIAIADLLAAIDSTAVIVAMPRIAHDLSLSAPAVSFIQIIYTFALITALIPAGKIGDVIGHKKIFLTGLAIFGLASLCLTVVPSFTLLLILRVIQGVAGGMLYTSSGALIAHHWKSTEQAFGITAAVFGIGMLIGPLLGGLLSDSSLGSFSGWHFIFAINVPITLIGIWLIRREAKETPKDSNGYHVDSLGLLLFALTLGSLITCLMYNNYQVASGMATLAFLMLLVLREKNLANPLLNFEIFKGQTFAAIALFTTVAMFCLNGLSFINTFYVQTVLGRSAALAGIMLIPISVGMAVFSGVASTNKSWKRGAILGAILICGGLAVLAHVSPSVSYVRGLFIGYIVVSAGAGFMMTTTFAAALGSVSKQFVGATAGYINTVQQIGSLAGIAFVASRNVTVTYQSTYFYLTLIAGIGIIAALFVKNNQHNTEVHA